MIIKKDIKKALKGGNMADLETKKKNKGYCDSCKRYRILQPPTFLLCKTCIRSFRYWEKQHSKEPIKEIEKDQSVQETPKEKPTYIKIEKETEQKTPIYSCDLCDQKVNYLQVKCVSCNNILNWKGTPAENDPNVVICNKCGGNLGKNATYCKYCGFGANVH